MGIDATQIGREQGIGGDISIFFTASYLQKNRFGKFMQRVNGIHFLHQVKIRQFLPVSGIDYKLRTSN